MSAAAWLDILVKASYLVAATLFLLGLQRMASPLTARSGIRWAGLGMVIATVATFFLPGLHNIPLILAAVAIGTLLAWVSGKRVAITDMPQMVALYIFMLAAIAGHVIISRVPVILHTPLMSGSNFIHGIVLIGAMLVLGHAETTLEKAIGFVAVLMGAGNAAGGYVVTERMLEMFKPSDRARGGKEGGA